MSKPEVAQGSLPSLDMPRAPEAAPAAREAVGRPRVRPVERSQLLWQALDVERLIEVDHPARAIWELTGQLDLKGFYAEINAVEGVAGRTPWDPRLLISVWVYAYSRGISSAREIARRCQYEPAFQWLCGLGEINHHTLSDFRVAHDTSLRELLAQVLGVLSAQGLITLERVMQDGTKIKAHAASKSFLGQKGLEEHLAAARQQVAEMGEPGAEETAGQRAAQERAAREREERVAQALEQLGQLRERKKPSEAERVRVSTTDPEARIMKQADGGFAPSYNVQVTTDAAHTLIVGVAVSQSGNDYGELVPAVERIEQSFGKKPGQVVSDGGFTSRGNILGMAAAGVDFYGSLQEPNPDTAGQLARRGIRPEFYTSAFVYDARDNSYRCPAGQILRQVVRQEWPELINYTYEAEASVCGACSFRAACCGHNPKQGRRVVRVEERPEVQAFRQKMQTEAGAQIYRQRSAVAEFPNAWIKAKLGLRQFRLRGLAKVRLETLWACLTYNIQQWIRLSWREKWVGAAA